MRSRLALVVAAVVLSMWHGEAQTSVVSFADTYKGTWLDGPVCAVTQPIVGYQPTTPGHYPLFVYEAGTLEPYNDASVDAILRAAAAHNFVAISAKFNNGFNRDCQTLNNKAACIYNGTAQSAISKGCARADCDYGIVVGGFSQGSQLALLAKNYDSRVLAVWAQGVSMSSNTPLDSCISAGMRVMPADGVRMINGEHDQFVPDSLAEEAITGMVCPGATNCLRLDGSGWIRVQDSEVGSGNADHTFFTKGFGLFETGYLPPYQTPWSIDRNMEWLQLKLH